MTGVADGMRPDVVAYRRRRRRVGRLGELDVDGDRARVRLRDAVDHAARAAQRGYGQAPSASSVASSIATTTTSDGDLGAAHVEARVDRLLLERAEDVAEVRAEGDRDGDRATMPATTTCVRRTLLIAVPAVALIARKR